MAEPTPDFDVWAIVELFGRQRIAGRVTNQNLGSATFIRVDVYEKNGLEIRFTRFFNPAAIYGISPAEKTAVLLAAAAIEDAEPIKPWELPITRNQRTLPGRLYGEDD